MENTTRAAVIAVILKDSGYANEVNGTRLGLPHGHGLVSLS